MKCWRSADVKVAEGPDVSRYLKKEHTSAPRLAGIEAYRKHKGDI